MAYAMTKRGSQDNIITYEFICDSMNDLAAIDNKYRTIGTVGIVLSGESGGLEVYICGSNKQFQALTASATSTSAAEAAGLVLHICGQGEYNTTTKVPTIEDPDEATLYLVPSSQTSGDLYDEYVYINDAWEKFGGARIDLSGYVSDVQVNGTSILSNGVANLTKASSSTLGLVKVNGYGLNIDGAGTISTDYATPSFIKAGYDSFKPITPTYQHQAVFYGLAKAAGQDMKESDNTVGTYTTEAAAAIRTMIGAGTYSKPAGGIPAADLAETYLTQHQDISGKANSADLATVATSGSYNDLSNKPTNVSAFTNDAGYLTQHQSLTALLQRISNLEERVTDLESIHDVSAAMVEGENGRPILDEQGRIIEFDLPSA